MAVDPPDRAAYTGFRIGRQAVLRDGTRPRVSGAPGQDDRELLPCHARGAGTPAPPRATSGDNSATAAGGAPRTARRFHALRRRRPAVRGSRAYTRTTRTDRLRRAGGRTRSTARGCRASPNLASSAPGRPWPVLKAARKDDRNGVRVPLFERLIVLSGRTDDSATVHPGPPAMTRDEVPPRAPSCAAGQRALEFDRNFCQDRLLACLL